MDCVDSTRCVVFGNPNASVRDMLGFLRERTTGLEPATPSLGSRLDSAQRCGFRLLRASLCASRPRKVVLEALRWLLERPTTPGTGR
jgi:hypothetical protein